VLTNASYDHDFFFWVANSNLKFCVAAAFLMFSLKIVSCPLAFLLDFSVFLACHSQKLTIELTGKENVAEFL